MKKGLIRSEIMKKIPELSKGSFRNFRLLAGIQPLGERQAGTGMAKVYPADSVEKIKDIMSKTFFNPNRKRKNENKEVSHARK